MLHLHSTFCARAHDTTAPYIPPIDPSNASDTQNFDDTFLDMEPVLDDINDEQIDTDQEPDQTDTDRTDGEESNTTPSQSRSSSIRPQQQPVTDDSVDVFDGYSFKGRHSVIDDDDAEDNASEEDSADDEDLLAALEPIDTTPPADQPTLENAITELPEPKTPEARPAALPEPEPVVETVPAPPPKETVAPVAPVEPSQEAEPAQVPQPRKNKDLPPPGPSDAVAPTIPDKDSKAKTVSTKAPIPRPVANRSTRTRREKSGVPALDRYLSDAIDEDTEATEREDEDDDWDFVEAADGEDRNGAKGTSLFARGVVDRYRLAVFRKASTPSQRSAAPRSVSGMSKGSEATVSEAADSPSPSQKRGRAPLTFRKNPRQFLRPKSPPPSSFSSKSSGTGKSLSTSNSNTLSAGSSSAGLLTPSPSFGSTMSHSLKSKESALSVGAQSLSSDQSGNGESGTAEALASDTLKGSPLAEGTEKPKNKKLKKYKENAEKVFSLFSSPRQPS